MKVTPFVAPPPLVRPPEGFIPGAFEDGVQRNAEGHIIGIHWGALSAPNLYLLEWKDRAIGPGHPLASHIDPRSFIPCAAPAPAVAEVVKQLPPELVPDVSVTDLSGRTMHLN